MKTPLDRGGLRFFLVLIALIRGAATYSSILAGTPCILLSAALHLWAKGCLRQNQFVAMGGPYRFVRHPFYLANALIDAGIAVMSGWWILQGVLPVWWLAIYIPVMRNEEDYLTGAFGSVYSDYKRRVPRLLPWRRPLPATGQGFSWRNPNIVADSAIPRVLRILAYPLLFFVCMGLRTEGTAILGDAVQLAALAILGVLYALAWEFTWRLRRRESLPACPSP